MNHPVILKDFDWREWGGDCGPSEVTDFDGSAVCGRMLPHEGHTAKDE